MDPSGLSNNYNINNNNNNNDTIHNIEAFHHRENSEFVVINVINHVDSVPNAIPFGISNVDDLITRSSIQSTNQVENSIVKTQSPSLIKPVIVYSLAILLAWIYVVIPNENYWVYSLVRNQWWSLLLVFGYTEMEDFCMPDASNRTYIWTYIVGFLSPAVFRALAWLGNLQNNTLLILLIPASPWFTILVFYGFDAVMQPVYIVSTNETVLFDTLLAVRNESLVPHSVNLRLTENCPSPIHEDSLQMPLALLGAYTHPDMRQSSTDVETSHVLALSSKAQRDTVATLHEDKAVLRSSIQYAGVFRYLPRFLYPKYSNHRPRLCTSNRIKVFIVASLFSSFWVIIWMFIMNFTLTFRAYSNDGQSLVLLFIVFVGCNNVLRAIMKRIGLWADKLKQHSTSMFFVAETLCLLFYYTFYRVLFQSIDNWSTFVAIQVLHLSAEWIIYPFRASDLFHRMCNFLRNNGGRWGSRMVDVLYSSAALDDWKKFIALDFGIRVTVVIASGMGMSLMLASVSNLPWVTNSLAQDPRSEAQTIMWIGLAVVLELFNALCINTLFFAAKGFNVRKLVSDVFDDNRFSFLIVIIAAVLFLNPIFAFTTNDRYHHEQVGSSM